MLDLEKLEVVLGGRDATKPEGARAVAALDQRPVIAGETAVEREVIEEEVKDVSEKGTKKVAHRDSG